MVNKVTTEFVNDTKGAVKSTDALATSIDDVGSKAKLVAQALHEKADQIDADFKNSVAAADALGAALGPELRAKIGQDGIDKFVADLKSAGLTADDIRGDVGDLAGALQHLDDVGKNISGPKQGLDDVGSSAETTKGKLAGMRGEGDNSRSVLANMVGNSTQDIAGLGGVAGTAGLALGQMGEYAADGNIKLSSLAKVAGPLAAVGLVAYGINRTLGEMAATKAFDKKQIEDWSQAIRNGKGDVDDFAAAATAAGKIDFRFLGDTKDLVPILSDLNISSRDWFETIRGGKDARDEFLQNAKDAGGSGDQLIQIQLALIEAQKNYKGALEKTGDQQKVFGDTTEAAALKAKAATKTYEDQVTTTSDEVQRKIDEMTSKWDELNGRINAEKSMIQYKQQVDDVKKAIADAGQAEIDHGVGSPEAIAAKEAARLKTLDLETTTADLGQTILGLPAEQVTDLIARIDRGELDNMPGIIQGVLDSHTYRINAHLDNIIIDGETHAAGSTGNVSSVSVKNDTITGHKAAGGPVAAGASYLVGEQGPEVVTMAGNGSVTPNRALGGVHVEAVHVHVQNMPTPNELVVLLAKYTKWNGPGALKALTG